MFILVGIIVPAVVQLELNKHVGKQISPKTHGSQSDRRCSNCGRQIPEDAKVCPYCGKRFQEFI